MDVMINKNCAMIGIQWLVVNGIGSYGDQS